MWQSLGLHPACRRFEDHTCSPRQRASPCTLGSQSSSQGRVSNFHCWRGTRVSKHAATQGPSTDVSKGQECHYKRGT